MFIKHSEVIVTCDVKASELFQRLKTIEEKGTIEIAKEGEEQKEGTEEEKKQYEGLTFAKILVLTRVDYNCLTGPLEIEGIPDLQQPADMKEYIIQELQHFGGLGEYTE